MPSSDPSPELVFDLRCRDAEWLDRPAVLDDFARPAPTPDPYGPLAELLAADLFARAYYKVAALAEGRAVISCETARYGIPVGVRDLDRPPIDDWLIREVIRGDLLDLGPDGRIDRSLTTQIRRGLIAVAGALPLLVSPMLAHAGSPGFDAIELQQALEGFAPPKLPDDHSPAPAPVGPAVTEGPATIPVNTAAPQLVPVEIPPPRISNESLSLTGTAVWIGLLGKRVKLSMKNEQVVQGTVIAQSAADLAIARASDGTVVSVPKREIGGVGLMLTLATPGGLGSDLPMSIRPTEDGRGAYAGGVVMVVLGSMLALSGTVFLAITPYFVFISLPQLLPGLAIIGGGAGLMVAGAKKKKAFNKAWGIPAGRRAQLTPTLNGLALRF